MNALAAPLTDEAERVAKFDAWFDSMLTGWACDGAMMQQIMANPDATPRQLAWVHETARTYKARLAEIEVRAAIELGRVMNSVEQDYGRPVLQAMLKNPEGIGAALAEAAQAKFGVSFDTLPIESAF